MQKRFTGLYPTRCRKWRESGSNRNTSVKSNGRHSCERTGEMREYRRFWTAFGVRKSFTIRWWRGGNPLKVFWRWISGKQIYGAEHIEFELDTQPQNQYVCYCPT